MYKTKHSVKKIWEQQRLFVLASIMFAVLFSFCKISLDDIGGMRVPDGTWIDYFNKCYEMYFGWSSRFLINFVIFSFTGGNRIAWAIFMGISFYILVIALSELCLNYENISLEAKQMGRKMIVVLIYLLPFEIMNSAGWMATTITYFAPSAFGMMSLIPIKKMINDEKITGCGALWYAVCLMFGANNEQLLIVLLGCYFLAIIWLIIHKKSCAFIIVYFIITVGNLVNVVLCPGNSVRKDMEITTWFPAFPHLDFINKLQIGYEVAVKDLFFEGNIFLVVAIFIMTYLVLLEYKEVSFIKGISKTFFTIIFLAGPMNGVIRFFYPQISVLTAPISMWGLVDSYSRGSVGSFTHFLLLSLCVAFFVIDILLLCNSMLQFIACVALFGLGMLSRVAMCLSPTIYASGRRTSLFFYVCTIAVIIFIYGNQCKRDNNVMVAIRKYEWICNVLLVFAIINLAFLITNFG